MPVNPFSIPLIPSDPWTPRGTDPMMPGSPTIPSIGNPKPWWLDPVTGKPHFPSEPPLGPAPPGGQHGPGPHWPDDEPFNPWAKPRGTGVVGPHDPMYPQTGGTMTVAEVKACMASADRQLQAGAITEAQYMRYMQELAHQAQIPNGRCPRLRSAYPGGGAFPGGRPPPGSTPPIGTVGRFCRIVAGVLRCVNQIGAAARAGEVVGTILADLTLDMTTRCQMAREALREAITGSGELLDWAENVLRDARAEMMNVLAKCKVINPKCRARLAEEMNGINNALNVIRRRYQRNQEGCALLVSHIQCGGPLPMTQNAIIGRFHLATGCVDGCVDRANDAAQTALNWAHHAAAFQKECGCKESSLVEPPSPILPAEGGEGGINNDQNKGW